MNFRTTLILFLLVAALAIGFWVANRTSTQPALAPEQNVIDIPAALVTHLAITSGEGKKVVLDKMQVNGDAAAEWRMTEPFKASADSDAVTSLLIDILSLKPRQVIGQKDVSHTGIDHPQYTIELSTADSKSATLLIGQAQPVGDGMYVRVAGQKPVYVVPADLLAELDRPAVALRNLQLVQTPASQIQQIMLRDKQGTVTLQRVRHHWMITAPTSQPADRQEVDSFLAALTALRATDFVEHPVSAGSNLGEPALTVSICTTQPATMPGPSAPLAATGPALPGMTLTFGQYDDLQKNNVLVSTSDLPDLAKVASAQMEKLEKSPLDFRDRTVLQLPPDHVAKVRLEIFTSATTTQPARHEDYLLEPQVDVGQIPPCVAAPGYDRFSLRYTPSPPATMPANPRATGYQLASLGRPSDIVWHIQGTSQDVPNARIGALLHDQLADLKADRFLKTSPVTQPSDASVTYHLQLYTESARYDLRLFDRGLGLPVIGQYDDLTFELPHTFLRTLQGSLTQMPAQEPINRAAQPPQQPFAEPEPPDSP